MYDMVISIVRIIQVAYFHVFYILIELTVLTNQLIGPERGGADKGLNMSQKVEKMQDWVWIPKFKTSNTIGMSSNCELPRVQTTTFLP